MLSMDCSVDFDQGFWSDFDKAMLKEWDLVTVTRCHELQIPSFQSSIKATASVNAVFPSTIKEYKALANQLVSLYNETGSSKERGTTWIAISKQEVQKRPTTSFLWSIAAKGASSDLDLYDAVLAEQRGALAANKLYNEGKRPPVIFLTEYSLDVFQRPDASGIAYVKDGIGFVQNNFEYSTANLSHEILHLALAEQGHGPDCYADKVHENQFYYSLKQMGKWKKYLPIIKHFECD